MPDVTTVLVPGLTGSRLTNTWANGEEETIWLNYSDIATRRMEKMRLAQNGIDPQEPNLVFDVKADGILSAYYDEFYRFFASKGPVAIFAYDWRKSCVTAGQELANFLQPYLSAGDVYLVGHSFGGLVCRIAEAEYRGQPRHDRIKRVVQISAPNYGSWEVCKFMNGISSWLKPYVALGGAASKLVVGVWGQWLMSIASRYFGVWECLIHGWDGPWTNDQVAQDLFNVGSYQYPWRGGHDQAMLDKAKATQLAFPALDTHGLYLCIGGYRTQTVSGLPRLEDRADGRKYTYDLNGDGTVPQVSAILDATPAIYSRATHASMPQNRTLLDAIWANIASGPENPIILTS